MKTIALRFSDNYAPEEGTINLHKDVINKYGYVWYGKFGNSLSQKNIELIMSQPQKKILLIKSGYPDRYWVYFDTIQKEKPIDVDKIPEYYRNSADRIGCWFKVLKIEKAENNIMSKFIISSSKTLLSDASKHSMNPYFIIESIEL